MKYTIRIFLFILILMLCLGALFPYYASAVTISTGAIAWIPTVIIDVILAVLLTATIQLAIRED